MRVATFVEREGHGWIPQRCKKDGELGRWAKNRRSEKKRNKLSMERVKLLNDLGFVWEVRKKVEAEQRTSIVIFYYIIGMGLLQYYATGAQVGNWKK